MATRAPITAAFVGALLAGILSVGSAAADAAPPVDGALSAAVMGPQRTPAHTARDSYRHPLDALSFWGLAPGMTVIELWPSGGYWTEILAPYAKATAGHYIAAIPSAERKLPERFADASVFGKIEYTVFNKDSGPLVPPATADFVLSSRNLHDWMWTSGFAEKSMSDAFAALKPGGVLAVVEHRSDPRPTNNNARDGYMNTGDVVAMAEKAGFKLEAKSEINANPKDTKDHPFGVWTLPPVKRSAPPDQPPNPNFDRAKYDAIGESDRMTLRFRKPD